MWEQVVACVLRHLIYVKLMYLPVILGGQNVLGREFTHFISFVHFVDDKIIQISITCAEHLELAQN